MGIKVSPGPKALSAEMVSIGAILPEVQVIEGSLQAAGPALLCKWVELNRDVLIRFWDGDFEYTGTGRPYFEGLGALCLPLILLCRKHRFFTG